MLRVVDNRDDLDRLADDTDDLRSELRELGVVAHHLEDSELPEGAKGLGLLAGWLGVKLKAVSLGAVVARANAWAKRTDKVIEVTMGGDTLRLTGVTSEQQDAIIETWVRRHTAALRAE